MNGKKRQPAPGQARRVLLLGATGTIGRATCDALLAAGHEVVCFVRDTPARESRRGLPCAAAVRFGDVTDPASIFRDGLCGEPFDAVVSCLASRTGTPEDAWAIDHRAHLNALSAAHSAGVGHFVLLSAICVQKPELEFQHAKLAFERALMDSGMTHSIIRPTAYFKSLSGQLDRLRAGKPYLLFGDGRLTACKPISDRDLARYIAGCLDDPLRWDRTLPVGGPGPALTPLDMGQRLFELLQTEPRFRRVPVALMNGIVAGLTVAGHVAPRLRPKAELARIGRYYATESMLVRDSRTGRYSAAATPSFGEDTLFDFYARLVRGETSVNRGDHAVF
ncbi:NAD(P)H-binding protein [Roseovarius salis]|uniref:NAD(P)H-binding protein n=1 Tax=Roseovarius salis TaxID=3376063 RepID=UPI0037C81197